MEAVVEESSVYEQSAHASVFQSQQSSMLSPHQSINIPTQVSRIFVFNVDEVGSDESFYEEYDTDNASGGEMHGSVN